MDVGKRRGFTLIELMLSILLVAIMMSAVYGVVVSTVQAQERIEELTFGTEIAPVILNQMRQDLESAVIPDDSKEFFLGSDKKGAYGDRDRVDFVAAVTAFGTDDADAEPRFHMLNEVGYVLQDSKERPGESVLFRREDLWLDAEPLRGGRLTELYDRMLALKLEYYDGQGWRETWATKDQGGKLPEAVRITIKLKVPDGAAPEGMAEREYSLTVSRPK